MKEYNLVRDIHILPTSAGNSKFGQYSELVSSYPT